MTALEAYDYALKQGERYNKIQKEIKLIDDQILEACISGKTYVTLKGLPLEEVSIHFTNLGYLFVDGFRSISLSWYLPKETQNESQT